MRGTLQIFLALGGKVISSGGLSKEHLHHCFGDVFFDLSDSQTLIRIQQLKTVYGVSLEFDAFSMHIYKWMLFTCHFWELFSQCSFHMTDAHLANGYYWGPCGTVFLD